MSTKPWWDFPRTTIAAGQLLDTGRAHGLTDIQVLGGTGITLPMIATSATIDASQELEVARNLLRRLGPEPGLGAEAGSRYHVGSLDVLAFALTSAATNREAMQVALRSFSSSHAVTRLRVDETAEAMTVRFDVEQIPADVRGFFLERDRAATLRLLPFADASPHEGAGFAVARHLLDAPGGLSDPRSAEISRRQCSDLLDRRRHRTGLGADVRAVLVRAPGAMPAMDRVAAELHLTGRTLERRLAADGTSYRALREEVLEAIATTLLGSGFSVESVGRRLGYSEVAAFSRAYKSWTGRSPSRSGSLVAQRRSPADLRHAHEPSTQASHPS